MNNGDGQQPLFYEDIHEAIDCCIADSGKTKKSLAMSIYPGRTPETAKSLFSRALSPENEDVRLSMEALLKLLDETNPAHVINYLCDRYRFNRPERKERRSFEREAKQMFEQVTEGMKMLSHIMAEMDKEKEEE